MLEFKEQDCGYYVVEQHKDSTITSLGIIRKSESLVVGSYVFDPTNFTYTSEELAEISKYMKKLDKKEVK